MAVIANRGDDNESTNRRANRFIENVAGAERSNVNDGFARARRTAQRRRIVDVTGKCFDAAPSSGPLRVVAREQPYRMRAPQELGNDPCSDHPASAASAGQENFHVMAES